MRKLMLLAVAFGLAACGDAPIRKTNCWSTSAPTPTMNAFAASADAACEFVDVRAR